MAPRSCETFAGSLEGLAYPLFPALENALVTIYCWMIDSFLERALEMWKRFCRTSEPQRFADIISSSFAKLTFETRQSNFESNSIAHFQIGYF
jgi:hypothetical protein